MPLVMLGPDDVSATVDLFLAGGISNCPDWQAEAVELLAEGLKHVQRDVMVANPRRAEGLESTGPAAARQIAWEHNMLSKAALVSFWFPKETLCPITLLELGVQMGEGRAKVIVAAEGAYARRFDLIEQIGLARVTNNRLPLKIHDSIHAMVEESLELLGIIDVGTK